MRKLILLCTILLTVSACKKENSKTVSNETLKTEVQAFLDDYTATFKELYYNSSKAEWDANTKIIAGDSTNARNVQEANGAYAKFTGSIEVIEKTRNFLESKDQ